jgi:uncharacterized protein (DUF302 family)
LIEINACSRATSHSDKKESLMNYTIDKVVAGSFREVVDRTIAALKAEGFGVLTDIDVQATLKTKLDSKFRPYRILGACNPALAKSALEVEDKLGVMLPCNVIVQQKEGKQVEVSAIDPQASMERTGNDALAGIAAQVKQKLERVIAAI